MESWNAPLTAADRCDRCGAQAYHRVTLPNADRSELLFCGHHGRAHIDHVLEKYPNAMLYSELDKLQAVVATGD